MVFWSARRDDHRRRELQRRKPQTAKPKRKGRMWALRFLYLTNNWESFLSIFLQLHQLLPQLFISVIGQIIIHSLWFFDLSGLFRRMTIEDLDRALEIILRCMTPWHLIVFAQTFRSELIRLMYRSIVLVNFLLLSSFTIDIQVCCLLTLSLLLPTWYMYDQTWALLKLCW